MTRWGNVDFRQLQALQKRMQQLEKVDVNNLCIDISHELAQALLAKVVRRTPTRKPVYRVKIDDDGKRMRYKKGKNKGKYKKVRVVIGGTLKRNWDVTTVKRQGYSYKIEVFNDTEYAIYVEFGHRTSNHSGWVPGKFMLTISEKEVQNLAPKLVQRKLEAKLREVFDT